MNPPLQGNKSAYWREKLTEFVSVLGIGMSEVFVFNVNDDSETAHTPLSRTRFCNGH